jgi:hypothetical protein
MTGLRGRLALLGIGCALVLAAARAGAQRACVGDCDGNGTVTINELVVGVNIALGSAPMQRCSSFDNNHDGMLEINELLDGVLASVQGCAVSGDPTPTPTPEQYVADASDFECLTDWTRVRHFRITNKLGHLDEALAVAHGAAPPPYPVGTIIQLVPMEAMVKRGGGFFPDAHDWEFFVLSPSAAGTQILQRGREEVINVGPITCFGCHGAAPQTDFICESGNGCVALNLSEALIDALQTGDPRCPAQ